MADVATGAVKSGARKAFAAFFEYDTPKIVHIRSKKVGIINRFIQLCLLVYIIGYAIVWEKGYQEFDNVESAALTKVKGVVYTELKKYIVGVSNRTWDPADYVVPPEEADAFFVTTNVIYTANQTQETCDEDPTMLNVICTKDTDCEAGKPVVNGNGVRTGRCIPSTQQPGVSVCEVYAWCPVEKDELPIPGKALLQDSEHFTVLIKNWIEFPKFNKKRRNIIDDINNATYLQQCHYNADDPIDRFCPIFVLGTVVEEAGENYSEIAVSGGVIAISIHWDCNLDFDINDCKPKYGFKRLDDKDSKIAKGWNFRYAHYYWENGIQTRDLVKAYGIRFVIKVTGTAGKFSFVPLLLNLGSGLALLAVATIICDIIVLYILKKGPFYSDKKYLQVTDEDAFQGKFLDSASIGDSLEGSGESLARDQGRSYQATDEASGVTNRRSTKPGDYARLEDD